MAIETRVICDFCERPLEVDTIEVDGQAVDNVAGTLGLIEDEITSNDSADQGDNGHSDGDNDELMLRILERVFEFAAAF